MAEREHDVTRPPAGRPAAVPAQTAAAAALALQRGVGNRALGRVLARMEATEAVEALSQALAPGVLGAERQVVDTLTAFSSDVAGFDQVARDYEQKTKAPLAPAAPPELIPDGWFPAAGKG